MKNRDIAYLAKTPVGMITAHTLTAKESYNVFKFKKVLKDLYVKFCKDESELLKQLGIDDVRGFNEKIHELTGTPELTEDEKKELDRLLCLSAEFKRLDNELLSEDIIFDGVTPLCYESWFALQNENSAVEVGGKPVDILSGYTEEVLECVLWRKPEE